jgi:hypothetical protein
MDKYEMTDETMEYGGHTLHRIRALRDIPHIRMKSGDIGGWIEKEANLSQDWECWIGGDAKVSGNAMVCGDAKVSGNAEVCGDAEVYGNASVCGDAVIQSRKDYLVFKNNWSSGRYFTWTRSNNKWSVGCFFGTGAELIEKAYKDSAESGWNYENVVNYVERMLQHEKHLAAAKLGARL